MKSKDHHQYFHTSLIHRTEKLFNELALKEALQGKDTPSIHELLKKKKK